MWELRCFDAGRSLLRRGFFVCFLFQLICIEKRAGTWDAPLPFVPRALHFYLPQVPARVSMQINWNEKTNKEASAEERALVEHGCPVCCVRWADTVPLGAGDAQCSPFPARPAALPASSALVVVVSPSSPGDLIAISSASVAPGSGPALLSALRPFGTITIDFTQVSHVLSCMELSAHFTVV